MDDHTFKSISYSLELRAQRVSDINLIFYKQSILVWLKDPPMINLNEHFGVYDQYWKYILRESRLWTSYLYCLKSIYNICTLTFLFSFKGSKVFFFLHPFMEGVLYINIVFLHDINIIGMPCAFKRRPYIIL